MNTCNNPAPRPRPPCYYFIVVFLLLFYTTSSLQLVTCCPTRRCPRPSGSADLKGLRPLPPTPNKNKISDTPSKYVPRQSRDAFGSVSAFVSYFGRQLSSPQAPFGIHFSSSEGRWNSSGERRETPWRPDEAPGTREATSTERGAVD